MAGSGDDSLLTARLLDEAVALHRANQLDTAVPVYRQILDVDPDNVDAWHFLAIALQTTGDLRESVAAIRRAVSVGGNDPAVHLAATRIFYDAEQWTDCAVSANETLAADPDNLEIELMKVAALMALQRFSEAEDPAARLIKAIPEDKDVNNIYIRILLSQEKVSAAMALAQKLISLFPEDAKSVCVLALCLKRNNKYLEAESVLVAFLERHPQSYEALNELGDLYTTRGDTALALDLLSRSHALRPFNTYAMTRICFYSAFDHRVDAAELYRINRAYSEHLIAAAKSHVLPDPPVRPDDGKIHIGYLANDFNDNVTSWFVEPVFRRHDRTRFHVTCYSGATVSDNVTRRLSGLVDEWRVIHQVDVLGAADQIRRDGIDILVLASYYRGEDRQVLAHRIAPVQVGYQNRVASSALDTMDYVFTEEILDPTGKVEQFYSESPVRISNQCCYLPPRDAPPISPPPCLENGFITFGSFNNLSKINIDVIRTWSALLDAVPDSQLLLRFSKYFDIAGTIEIFRDQFVSFGVDPERLIFQGYRETRRDHLSGMLEADITLDPFPCNGGTTSCESLWMGVPLITMNCDTFMGRQGISNLTKAGLTDLVARTSAEYVEIGRKLSLDFPRINALRSSLRQTVEDKFFRYDRHIMEMETAFSHMWARHLAGDAHTPFYVTDGTVTENLT